MSFFVQQVEGGAPMTSSAYSLTDAGRVCGNPTAVVCVPPLASSVKGIDKWPGQKHSVNKLFNIHYYGVNIVPLDR